MKLGSLKALSLSLPLLKFNKIIVALPGRQRIVVIKSIGFNCTQVNIAHKIGIAPQVVFNLRKRRLGRLKKMLEKHIYTKIQKKLLIARLNI